MREEKTVKSVGEAITFAERTSFPVEVRPVYLPRLQRPAKNTDELTRFVREGLSHSPVKQVNLEAETSVSKRRGSKGRYP